MVNSRNLTQVLVSIFCIGCVCHPRGHHRRVEDLNLFVQKITHGATIETNEGAEIERVSLNLGLIMSEMFAERKVPRFVYDAEVEATGVDGAHNEELFKRIAKCKSLKYLDIAGLKHVSTLEFLEGLTQLKSLDLSFTDIPLSELLRLKNSKNLEELFLSGSSYSYEIRDIVGTLPNLRVLNIDGLNLTNDEVKGIIDACPSLELLYIRGNGAFRESEFQSLNKNIRVVFSWPNDGGIIN